MVTTMHFINWEKKQFNFEVKREWLRFAPGVVAAFNWMIQMLDKKRGCSDCHDSGVLSISAGGDQQ